MEIITSISNQKIKDIKKLRLKKYRDKSQEFIVEGEHLVEEALKNKCLKSIITTDHNYDNEECEILYVNENVMKQLSLLKSLPTYIGVCNILENKIALDGDIVILDGVQDPGNLGTIIRSALAFNLTNMVLSPDCVDIHNPKVIQASQGAIFQVNVKYTKLIDYLKYLKEKEYLLLGTTLENGEVLSKDLNYKQKKAFIFGSEGQGISREILAIVDKNYYIEINNIESLNVSCAAAIIFYQFSTRNGHIE